MIILCKLVSTPNPAGEVKWEDPATYPDVARAFFEPVEVIVDDDVVCIKEVAASGAFRIKARHWPGWLVSN